MESSGGGSHELRWSCTIFDDLLHRCWEGEYFLFSPHTGHTHVVNQLSWDILSRCANTECSERDLYELVLATGDPADSDGMLESLDIHLDHLAQLGFLRQIDNYAVS